MLYSYRLVFVFAENYTLHFISTISTTYSRIVSFVLCFFVLFPLLVVQTADSIWYWHMAVFKCNLHFCMHGLWWMVYCIPSFKVLYLPLGTEILLCDVTRGRAFLFLAHINEVLPGLCSGPVKVPLFCSPVWFAFTPKVASPLHKIILIYDVPDIYYYGKSDIYFCRGKSDHVAFIRVFPDLHLHLTYLKLRKLEKELHFSNGFFRSVSFIRSKAAIG